MPYRCEKCDAIYEMNHHVKCSQCGAINSLIEFKDCPLLRKREVYNRDGTWSWDYYCGANGCVNANNKEIDCRLPYLVKHWR